MDRIRMNPAVLNRVMVLMIEIEDHRNWQIVTETRLQISNEL